MSDHFSAPDSIPSRPTVLAIDDEQDNLDLVTRALSPHFDVICEQSGGAAMERFKHIEQVDVLLVDQRMPGMQGTEFLHWVNETVSDAARIVKVLLTGYTEPDDIIASINVGRVDFYYTKPFKPGELLSTIRRLLALKYRERRTQARANLPHFKDIVTASGTGLDKIQDISQDGLFLSTYQRYETGARLPVTLTLPGGEQLCLSGRIARLDPERGGVGIQFVDMEDPVKRKLKTLIIDHFSAASLEELKKKYAFLNIDDLVLFTDPSTIETFLEDALEREQDFSLVPAYGSKALSGTLLYLDSVEKVLTLKGEDLEKTLHVGESALVSAYEEWRTQSFETTVLQVGEGQAQLVYPQALFYVDKRKSERNQPGLDVAPRKVEIPLAYPPGAILYGSEVDFSSEGMAILVQEPIGMLFPGTPIPQLRVVRDGKVEWSGCAEVRHIGNHASCPDGTMIGVQFGVARRPVRTLDTSQLFMKAAEKAELRSDTAGQPDLSTTILTDRPLVDIVRFPNADGQELVGILNLLPSKDQNPVPVVLLPPAWGKTKETLFALALTLEESFRAQGKPIAILRYDGANRRGESFHDADCDRPDTHALHATPRQGAIDLAGALEFAKHNPRFRAGPIFVVTFSLATLEARLLFRDPEKQHLVDRWIVCVGTPEVRHIVTRIGGNFDIFEAHRMGMHFGMVNYLGVRIDSDFFISKSVEDGLVGLEGARKDFGSFGIPISWIYGEHDHWVVPDRVHDVMSIDAKASRDVMAMPVGHNMRTSMEAMTLFGAVTQMVKYHLKQPGDICMPHMERLNRIQIAERERRPIQKTNLKEYWKRYLLGEQGLMGFDVFRYSDDYIEFMHDHIDWLDISGNETLAEFGVGTGNLFHTWLKSNKQLPAKVFQTEFVAEALEKAKSKQSSRMLGDTQVEYLVANLELNRYRPYAAYLKGDLYAFRALFGQIEGLKLDVVEEIEKKMNATIHGFLKGTTVTTKGVDWLRGQMEWETVETICDLSLAARVCQEKETKAPAYRRLIFPKDPNENKELPFEANSVDRVLGSLVLPYIFNPGVTLAELFRILKPNGIVVLSTMVPDTDTSGIYIRLIEKLEHMPEATFEDGANREQVLQSARMFLNDAAGLLDLEERGIFEFFSDDSLHTLFEQAGFSNIEMKKAFGNPSQATIVKAVACKN